MLISTNTGANPATNAFLVADEAPPQAALFDAPDHTVGPLLHEAQKRSLDGDRIIRGAIGRTGLPHSDHAELERSIRKIMQLPGDTRLLPGHGNVSTLDLERQQNPYVQQILAGGE